ncbi:hypothetical protein MNEG_16012, partial [Monoraphidium neglectum]
VGFESFGTDLPEDATEEEVLAVVEAYNADPNVHGILVQLPVSCRQRLGNERGARRPDARVGGGGPPPARVRLLRAKELRPQQRRRRGSCSGSSSLGPPLGRPSGSMGPPGGFRRRARPSLASTLGSKWAHSHCPPSLAPP